MKKVALKLIVYNLMPLTGHLVSSWFHKMYEEEEEEEEKGQKKGGGVIRSLLILGIKGDAYL